jgi:hypothetical protein
MKRLLIVLVGMAYLALAGSGACMAEELPPDEIITKSWELFRQVDHEKESVRIVMSYSDGRKEERKLVRWTRFDPGGEDSITIKFIDPPLERGLGLLTLRHAQREDEQWLKLPSLKKVRKVAAGEQDKYFAGTDLTNEDIRRLIGERVRDFTYSLAKKEGDASIIEAVPRAGTETGYGRRLIWVNEKLAITRVEYFGKKGELIKTQANSGITVSEKGLWRTDHVELDNLLLKRKTQIDIEERELDRALSPSIFSKDFLESERM